MLPPEPHRSIRLAKAAVVLGSLGLLLLSVGATADSGQARQAGLKPIPPEAAGWSSARLEEARAFADKINSAAVMVLYDGRALVSWGNVARKYRLHSIRKPLLGALFGIYVKRGKIDLDATLEQLGIRDPGVASGPASRAEQVRDPQSSVDRHR